MLTSNVVFTKVEVSSLQVKSEYSRAQTKFYHDKNNIETEDLRKPVIIVGCVLVFLVLVNGLKWISKPIRNTYN